MREGFFDKSKTLFFIAKKYQLQGENKSSIYEKAKQQYNTRDGVRKNEYRQ